MVRDGLIQNSAWIPPACDKAVRMFTDSELFLPATFLAALNEFAIDYIQQAPILVLAVTGRANLTHRKVRLSVAKCFTVACSTSPRLSELMKSYRLAPQLRALSGSALRRHYWPLLTILSTIPPSTLAQSIPKSPEKQRKWLDAVMYTWQRFRSDHRFVAWGAANLRDGETRCSISDIGDFARNNRGAFNWRWNFAQAKAASDRWQCAPKARNTCGGGFHLDSCR
jgi:hypothetical protein